MASETVRQGRAAWERLKRGSRDWSDWKIVGAALLEGRAITMRDAGATRARGGGVGAFSDWLINNRGFCCQRVCGVRFSDLDRWCFGTSLGPGLSSLAATAASPYMRSGPEHGPAP